MAAKSKQLTYELEEPAFLKKLRAETGGFVPEKRYIAPRNKKTAVDEAEDEPLYVVEDGQELSASEFKKLSEGKDEDTAPTDKSVVSLDNVPTSKGTEEKVIIGSKKRKQVQAVGQVSDDEGSEARIPTPSKKAKETQTRTKKPKTKKAVKLSFDDE